MNYKPSTIYLSSKNQSPEIIFILNTYRISDNNRPLNSNRIKLFRHDNLC